MPMIRLFLGLFMALFYSFSDAATMYQIYGYGWWSDYIYTSMGDACQGAVNKFKSSASTLTVQSCTMPSPQLKSVRNSDGYTEYLNFNLISQTITCPSGQKISSNIGLGWKPSNISAIQKWQAAPTTICTKYLGDLCSATYSADMVGSSDQITDCP